MNVLCMIKMKNYVLTLKNKIIILLVVIFVFISGYITNSIIPTDCTGNITFKGTFNNTIIETDSRHCNVRIHDAKIIHKEETVLGFYS